MEIPRTWRQQKTYSKVCEYPGCNKKFKGIKVSKFCAEHRKTKYHSYYKPRTNEVGENQRIKHHCIDTTILVYNCDCCGTPFSIRLQPHTDIYPRFCPVHRNEYRRERYLRSCLSMAAAPQKHRSTLNKVLAKVNAAKTENELKDVVVTHLQSSRVNNASKEKMIKDICDTKGMVPTLQLVYNLLLKYEGLGVINGSNKRK